MLAYILPEILSATIVGHQPCLFNALSESEAFSPEERRRVTPLRV